MMKRKSKMTDNEIFDKDTKLEVSRVVIQSDKNYIIQNYVRFKMLPFHKNCFFKGSPRTLNKKPLIVLEDPLYYFDNLKFIMEIHNGFRDSPDIKSASIVGLVSLEEKKYVLKSIPYAHQDTTEKSLTIKLGLSEAQFLMEIQHKNIVQCYGVVHDTEGQELHIFFEYLRGNDLFTITNRHLYTFDYTFSTKKIKGWITQILKGLDALHKKNIIHRDIKLENIFLCKDGTIKILDLGLSNKLKNGERVYTRGGSIYTVAPEILKGQGAGKTADFWGLGIITYMMLTGCHLFDDKYKDHNKIIDKIKNFKNLKVPKKLKKKKYKLIVDLMSKLLEPDYKKRIGYKNGIAEIFKHPFLKDAGKESIKNKYKSPTSKPT
ncbi:serine/threonine-protein kinase [Candidatus Margulisiibacteriota bacterium]